MTDGSQDRGSGWEPVEGEADEPNDQSESDSAGGWAPAEQEAGGGQGSQGWQPAQGAQYPGGTQAQGQQQHQQQPAGGWQQGQPGYGRARSYGGFWRRFAAYLIDAILLNIVISPITLGIGATPPWEFEADPTIGPAFWGAQALSVLLPWLYFAFMESSDWQATLGKKVLSLKVTDYQGNPISFGRATGRYFGKILSAIILLIGFIMIGFTQKKQGLHDMLANTLVFKES